MSWQPLITFKTSPGPFHSDPPSGDLEAAELESTLLAPHCGQPKGSYTQQLLETEGSKEGRVTWQLDA